MRKGRKHQGPVRDKSAQSVLHGVKGLCQCAHLARPCRGQFGHLVATAKPLCGPRQRGQRPGQPSNDEPEHGNNNQPGRQDERRDGPNRYLPGRAFEARGDIQPTAAGQCDGNFEFNSNKGSPHHVRVQLRHVRRQVRNRQDDPLDFLNLDADGATETVAHQRADACGNGGITMVLTVFHACIDPDFEPHQWRTGGLHNFVMQVGRRGFDQSRDIRGPACGFGSKGRLDRQRSLIRKKPEAEQLACHERDHNQDHDLGSHPPLTEFHGNISTSLVSEYPPFRIVDMMRGRRTSGSIFLRRRLI